MSIFNNLKWNTFSQVFKILTQLISIVYLARIIPPNEYGIMAMAGVVMNFASLFRDLGTSAAIIQKEQLQDETKSAVFWLNFLLGFLVFIIIITLTPFISHFYNQPKLLIVLPLLSFSFIISGSSSLHLAMLERESKFFIISKIEVFSAALSLLLAIILANNSFGIYSLVFQSLLNSLSSAVLLWIVSPWRPKGKPRHVINHLKEIFRFTSQLSLFNIINFFARNLDSFLIGKYMSASILGSYNLAYRIMLFPLSSLTFIANRSLFPILSQKKNNYKEINDIYLNTIYIIWFITLPLVTVITSLNKLFIQVVFGEQWILSADILFWLAPTAIIQSVLSTTGTIFMSQGRTGILLLLGIQGTILTAVSFMVGIHCGIVDLAKYYFIANAIHFIPCFIFTMKTIKSNVLSIFKKTYPLFISAAMSFILISNIRAHFASDIKSLFVLSAIGGAIYLLLLLPTSESRKLIKTLQTKIKKR